MFSVNDYIMYGTVGVCKVIDIKREKFLNSVEKASYVLTPVYSKNTIIKIPVDNEKIPMRYLLTKEDVDFLINTMPNKEVLWIDDDKMRSEQFKTMLKSGECEELITLIRSIYLNKKERKSFGKKSFKTDDEIMQTAEKLLNEEFGVILGIPPEEVPNYIKNHIA